MTSQAKSVDAFLAALPAEKRTVLEPLCKAIGKAAPKAVESMDYGMPCWKLGDEMLCALNAQKNYFSFYIASSAHAACAELLQGLDCGKSCIRFKHAEQLPATSVTKLVQTRLAIWPD